MFVIMLWFKDFVCISYMCQKKTVVFDCCTSWRVFILVSTKTNEIKIEQLCRKRNCTYNPKTSGMTEKDSSVI